MATITEEKPSKQYLLKLTVLSKYSLTILWVFFSVLGNHLSAQVHADFELVSDSGCVPFLARFTDLSSSNVTYRQWDFGNGNVATGNNFSPSAAYNTAGVYDVTLTVSDGVDTNVIVKTAAVSVFDIPAVSFSHQSVVSGCADFDFSVTNTSPAGILPIVSWEWDFDDGTALMNGPNVSHKYTSPGFFNVSLIVTDSLGCSNIKVKPSLVEVYETPQANFFSPDSLNICGPPLTANFINTSTSPGGLGAVFQWNVNGTSSSAVNVNQTFTNPGGYDVELIVTNSIGCSDTLLEPNYVWIGDVIAGMIVPDTVCLYSETKFEDDSFGGQDFYWDFGDGDTATGDEVWHTYNNIGLYSITLVSSGGAACDDTTTQDIYVETVQANFTSTPHTACEVPFMVNFTDQSVGNIVAWEWRFGNYIGYPGMYMLPNSSNLPNPVNYYFSEDTFDDTLIVTSQRGCKDTLVVLENEEIIITKADWIASPQSGCAPLVVNFTNQADSMSRVVNWWWDFDDGSPLDYTLHPTHTFQNVGVYDVTLTVVSIDGCTNTYVNGIVAGNIQTADFTFSQTVACTSDTVYFTNHSTDSNLITSYEWDFGDGLSSSKDHPEHQYMDTGYLSITLIASYNGCNDTLYLDSAIYVSGPIINISGSGNCDSQKVFQFESNVIGGTNFYWDYGDGSPLDSSSWNPFHEFPDSTGNYVVEITVWDSVSGCSQKDQINAATRILKGHIMSSDTNICRGDTVYFDVGHSKNAIALVNWSVDGFSNTKTDYSVTDYVMNDMGSHEIFAVLRNMHGCYDTVSIECEVFEPIASFDANPVMGCAPLNVQFLDNSSSDTNIIAWNWNLGNGINSNLQEPSMVYNGDGHTTFNVVLTVTDTFGCENSQVGLDFISVIEPPSFFSIPDSQTCEYSTVTFANITTGNYTYSWNFGNGGTSNTQSPNHFYPTHGTYGVTLTVTDSIGCDSTFVSPTLIEVQETPTANFSATPSFTNCFPASIQFTDLSVYANVDYWSWNFGDSPNYAVLNTPGAQNLYSAPGLYDITLVVTTTFGCSDTARKEQFVNIGGPVGNVFSNPEISCLGQEVLFSVDSLNPYAEKFIWDFGDGVVDTSEIPNVSIHHQYLLPGQYNVSVVISDLQSVCQISDTLQVEVVDVDADFIISDSLGCTPLFFYVNNNSTGEDQINWVLDDILHSQSSLDSFLISDPGKHFLELIVFNNYGQCYDTAQIELEVYPNPDLKLSEDQIVCIGDSVQLLGSGASNYFWAPETYLSNARVSSPYCFPGSNITYNVTGIDSNNCEAKDTIKVSVQPQVMLDSILQDTSVFLGSELFLSTFITGNAWYSWSPDFGLGCSDCPSPLVEPDETTVYTLIYGDTNRCFSFDTTITVEVIDEFKVSIPNSFTPGGDQLNDTFFPKVYGVEEMVYLQIFDRWGQMVFESTDISLGWDGKVNNRLVSNNSTFSYKARFRRYNGELKDYVGMVLVLY